MDTGLEASFERCVDSAFAFLVDRGFARAAATRDPRTGIVTVAFLGHSLGVECTLDVREREVGCQIARLLNGGLPREYALNARGERVREGLLHWFHRRGLRYLDFTPPALSFAERIPVVVRHYANVMRDHAEPVLQDDPRALD